MEDTPNGILLVDKAQGWTSHDVVARARRTLGTRKIGHAGTLDPMATGLLLLGVGASTRLLTHMVGLDKTYTATIRLGLATVTDDREGEALSRSTEEQEGVSRRIAALLADPAPIREAVLSLTGDIEQAPSAVSAIKVDGRRAYDRVREGEQVELKKRPVTVYSFEVGEPRRASGEEDAATVRSMPGENEKGVTTSRRTSVTPSSKDSSVVPSSQESPVILRSQESPVLPSSQEPPGIPSSKESPVIPPSQESLVILRSRSESQDLIDIDATIRCSTGTYVRALARDLGAMLAVGGHLTALRRTSVGPFDVADAHPNSALSAESDQQPVGVSALLSAAEVSSRLFPVIELSAQQEIDLGHGKRFEVDRELVPDAKLVAAIAPDGRLVGLIEVKRGRTRVVTNFPMPAIDRAANGSSRGGDSAVAPQSGVAG